MSVASCFARAGKRLLAFCKNTLGDACAADQLIMDVAIDRIQETADRAITEARAGRLKELRESYELTSLFIGYTGCTQKPERNAIEARLAATMTECRKAGVDLTIKIYDGGRYACPDMPYPPSIVAEFKSLQS